MKRHYDVPERLPPMGETLQQQLKGKMKFINHSEPFYFKNNQM